MDKETFLEKYYFKITKYEKNGIEEDYYIQALLDDFWQGKTTKAQAIRSIHENYSDSYWTKDKTFTRYFDSFIELIKALPDTAAERQGKSAPQTLDEKDEETIKNLIAEGFIKENPVDGNKYSPIRRSTKQICKYLLLNGYNSGIGFNFVKEHIEHNLEDSTINNYLRELKKDIPLKKSV